MNLLYFESIAESKKKIFNIVSNIARLREPLLLYIILGFNYNIIFESYISEQDLEMLMLLLSECRLSLNKRLLRQLLNKKPIIVRLEDNLFFVKCVEDLYHASLCYEEETLDLIEHNVSHNGVFVDVGANIGGFTVRQAKKSRVYTFEPERRNYSILYRNLSMNNLKALTYNKDVSNISGKAKLYLSSYRAPHSIVESRNNYREVEATKLDGILIKEKSIDVIKIDVDGAEFKVLHGASKALLKTRLLVVEVTKYSKNKLFTIFLHAMGFDILKDSDLISYIKEFEAS